MKNFTELQMRILEKGNIDCIDIVQLLGDYHDNDLPNTLRGRLHSHIEQCDTCAELYAGYSFVVQLAGDLKTPAMPIGAKRRLREALNEKLGLSL